MYDGTAVPPIQALSRSVTGSQGRHSWFSVLPWQCLASESWGSTSVFRTRMERGFCDGVASRRSKPPPPDFRMRWAQSGRNRCGVGIGPVGAKAARLFLRGGRCRCKMRRIGGMSNRESAAELKALIGGNWCAWPVSVDSTPKKVHGLDACSSRPPPRTKLPPMARLSRDGARPDANISRRGSSR